MHNSNICRGQIRSATPPLCFFLFVITGTHLHHGKHIHFTVRILLFFHLILPFIFCKRFFPRWSKYHMYHAHFLCKRVRPSVKLMYCFSHGLLFEMKNNEVVSLELAFMSQYGICLPFPFSLISNNCWLVQGFSPAFYSCQEYAIVSPPSPQRLCEMMNE